MLASDDIHLDWCFCTDSLWSTRYFKIISNVGRVKSSVDDFVMERGTVSMRVAFVLRSAEVRPLFWDLCDKQGLSCYSSRPARRCCPFSPPPQKTQHAHVYTHIYYVHEKYSLHATAPCARDTCVHNNIIQKKFTPHTHLHQFRKENLKFYNTAQKPCFCYVSYYLRVFSHNHPTHQVHTHTLSHTIRATLTLFTQKHTTTLQKCKNISKNPSPPVFRLSDIPNIKTTTNTHAHFLTLLTLLNVV